MFFPQNYENQIDNQLVSTWGGSVIAYGKRFRAALLVSRVGMSVCRRRVDSFAVRFLNSVVRCVGLSVCGRVIARLMDRRGRFTNKTAMVAELQTLRFEQLTLVLSVGCGSMG